MKNQKSENQSAAYRVLQNIASRTLALAMALSIGGALATATAANTDSLPGLAGQPVEYFYTGKPYDADAESYTFKYRNYDPELNRWTSVDPSGFPDGANNSLYVNNFVTGSLDKIGLNIFLINNPSAALGGGHNAIIAGSGSTWTMKSYGDGTSNNVATDTYGSQSEAMAAAAGSGYKRAIEFGTTPEQDSAALAAADTFNGTNYDVGTNNCQDMANTALAEAGIPVNPDNNIPNSAYAAATLLAETGLFGEIEIFE